MRADRDVVIIGAGRAGTTVATLLRRSGHRGGIVVLGAERHAPYERPPLSKNLLARPLAEVSLSAAAYTKQGIDLRLGTIATAIVPDAGFVVTNRGPVPYDVLVLAPGARARALAVPGADLAGVHVLRSLDDAIRLERSLGSAERLVIVGGGWIGLEVAAAARAADVDVTVAEQAERVLSRVASTELADVLVRAHEQRGTTILTGTRVAKLTATRAGDVSSVVLADGRRLLCDAVVVGIGALPDVDLALGAGLRCDGGIVVDATARTSHPQIYAVGDATVRPHLYADALVRLESIPSATEQAKQAVADILGRTPPSPEVPWFWSDQFDSKVRIAGLLRPADRTVVRNVRDGRGIAVVRLKGSRVTCVETVDAAAAFAAARRLIEQSTPIGTDADIDRYLDADAGGAPTTARADGPPADIGSGSAPEAGTGEDRPGGATTGAPCKAVYVRRDGSSEDVVTVTVGQSLMEAALGAGVPGIFGECGGSMSCGTCHVRVEAAWRVRAGSPSEEETEMLEGVDDLAADSRLSCQIPMTPELDGIVVHVVEE